MADKKGAAGVVYRKADSGYFEKRGFRRFAGVWSLWALGVGAVISGVSTPAVLQPRKTSQPLTTSASVFASVFWQ